MGGRNGPRWGVLVMRVWVEERQQGSIRARITFTGGEPAIESTTLVIDGADQALRVIGDWLSSLESNYDSYNFGDDTVTPT